MGLQLTADEMRQALEEKGVPSHLIERAIAREFGASMQDSASTAVEVMQSSACPEFPIRITLPWSALVSDNRKHSATIVTNGETPWPKLVMTAPYREAKGKATAIARRVMQGCAPVDAPLAMRARVYVPDNRAGHDVANFAKCTQDAFQGVVYKNDAQLHRVTWERAGVDVDAPRAEIEIAPI